jgi:hypothetical protein
MNAEQQLMAQRAEIERLSQQLASLQAATKDKSKLAPPTPFEGRVNSNVLTWLLTIAAYLHGCNTPTERWPIVASTYLKGAALDWYHAWIVTRNGVPTVWEDFKTAICQRFRPVDSNRIGRTQLMELRMRPSDRGRGILQYVDRFNQLVNQVTDITENEKFSYFNQGLTAELQRLLIPLTDVNSVTQAISMVIRYEMLANPKPPQEYNNRGNQYQRTSASSPSAWNSRYSSDSSTAPTPSSSAPMELGSLSLETPAEEESTEQLHAMRNERLTPDQLEEHRRRGLCFRCHQQGHVSRQCPKGAARK